MKKWNLVVGLLASTLVLTTVLATSAYSADYKNGEILVKFKNDVRRDRVLMNQFYGEMGVTDVSRFEGAIAGYEKLKIRSTIKVEDAIQQALADPMVEAAQPNYILRIQPIGTIRTRPITTGMNGVFANTQGDGWPTEPTPPSKPTHPEVQPPAADVNPPVLDPQLGELYGMKKIQALEAWEQHTKGSKQIVVAVIDTGIDYNHEDLSSNVWRNPQPTQNDIVGFNFVTNDGFPFDDHGHGTHTSGTVGGVGGNGKGVSGVSQRVSVMGIKFLNARGSGTTEDAVKSINYAVAHGAKILSNSWGGTADDGNDILEAAIQNAEKNDVLFIAAAGNESTNNDTSSQRSYPASFKTENMISVAATDQYDAMASFSNYGEETTHLAAPGVKILSSTPGNSYQSFSGTSMACPHVAGAAAMVWSKHPSWTYKQVKAALLNSTDKVASLRGKVSTGGRLNVLKALSQ